MRVLMLNAFHWLKGGVERTVFDETAWLERAGHEVAHFAIRDPHNLPSPFADHFAPAADYSETTPAWRQLAQLPRAIWSAPAARALAGLLRAWQPDVAHVHAPSRYLTPSVIEGLERARVPVVMTLHDFKPWCTNRILFARGEMCVRCKGGHHWHAVAVGCVQRSRLKSLVGAIEAYDHDRRGAYRPVRRWIAPSRFVREQSVALGADAARVRLLAHGVEAPVPGSAGVPELPERFALYAGRLSEEKGVRLLPALARGIAPTPLVVAGGGPLAGWLADQANAGVRLLGHLGPQGLAAVRARAGAVVVPSLFPETFGYAVAEAQLDARAVIASRIGALGELVEHEVTGLLVPPGDDAALVAAARRTLAEPERARGWGEAARARARQAFDPGTHARGLIAIYEEALRG
ncbi:MAG TPA: glycosyltransferase [Verrucomicrobiae bacterium]|nr:glycosyltransferase [Verrucomicrobiae bacterium]